MRRVKNISIFLGFALAAVLIAEPAAARRKPLHKIFPANPDSVPLENKDADELGIPRYDNQEAVDEAIMGGELVPLEGLAVSGSLPKNRRYARREAVYFAQKLSGEFEQRFHKKLQIDSAVRPADCQMRLRRHNHSAAAYDGPAASTHERGTTVDFSRRLSKKEWAWLSYRLMYYRGLGQIRVIEERKCIHVFVRESSGDQNP